MMIFRIVPFLSLLLCAGLSVRAQGDDRSLVALAGPAGNYLYLVLPPAGQPFDSAQASGTDYYRIERASYDSTSGKTGTYKEVGKSQPVQNSRELRSYYSETDIAQLLKAYELPDEAALVDFFRTHRNPSSFGLYYLLLQTKLATGDVYLDKTAREGTVYRYRVTRVAKAGGETALGTAVVKTGAPNPLLALFRPRMRKVAANDTLLLLSWQLPVDSLLQAPPAGVQARDLAFVAGGLKARVMLDGGSGYALVEQLLPSTNDSEATRNIIFRQAAKPERQYNAYVLLEDEVGNVALPSDTLVAFTIGPNNMPKLKSLRTHEVVDGIRLSWPRVVPKPYIVGVKLMRYSEDDKGVEVGIVPVSDTAFIDYNVAPGISYRYFGEIVFLPGTGLEEIAPAQALGQSTLFSDPLAPFNMRISNAGENILLQWDAQKQASIFGYYIYRGTSPKDLQLVAGPVRGALQFLDTARYLSGRSQYFYAVQAENYRQVTSPMSEVVSITPARKIETVMPKSLQFYYAGQSLHIRFPDVREDDNAIVGYVVRGKEKGAPGFRFRSGLLRHPSTEDSSGFVQGSTYQYQVAAVSMRGDTSAYSELYEFFLPKDPVAQLGTFYVRNTSQGVTLSWPSVIYPNRKAYNIYRRAAEEAAYTKIATVPATAFSYSDATAQTDGVYVYVVSVIEADDREGERGEAKSIRCEPVKVTTISE